MRVANTLILFAIIINITSRFFPEWSGIFGIHATPTDLITWDVYDYTNICCLIIHAGCCWMLSKRVSGAFAMVLMVSLLFDKLWGRQTHPGINDWIFYGIAFCTLFVAKTRDRYFWALASIAVLKVITDNTHYKYMAFGSERSVFEVGDSWVSFLYAVYFLFITMFLHKGLNRADIIPTFFVGVTLINLLMNMMFDVRSFHIASAIAALGVIIAITWGKLKERYGRTPYIRRQYNQFAVALAVFYLLLLCILAPH